MNSDTKELLLLLSLPVTLTVLFVGFLVYAFSQGAFDGPSTEAACNAVQRNWVCEASYQQLDFGNGVTLIDTSDYCYCK